jgi:acyl carrier protein
VPLPGYPFQRLRYLLEAGPTAAPRPPAPTPDAQLDAGLDAGLDTEQTVSMLFTEMLGLPDVDPQDNFFDLGGDSLVANLLVAKLEQLLPVELEVRSMYRAPSVRELAALIEERMRDSAVRHG